jgi:LuxR family maltose regulon positive regulatory protein
MRPDLFDRLDAGIGELLTLITGPAGAGKTLLLSSWLRDRPPAGPVAWLSLEPSDGRPIRFWTQLLSVVESAAGRDLGTARGLSDTLSDEFIAWMGAAMDALEVPVTVVLDDFEQLHSRLVAESLDSFLRFPQRGLRLVIASRIDPGLSLQRLRLDGRLTELRSRDLALSVDEARQLFELSGLELNEEQVAMLHQRTEGWVGGLSLAALSLRGHPDPVGFVRSFTGDERTVADYLIEEVLHQQSGEMHDFMMRTSVVDELEPGLVNALTGRDDGAALLAALERSNAFLQALDEHRLRYRYHPMFLELLRSQLRYRMLDAYRLQHRRAARWFAARGDAATAVRHAVAAGDATTASELVSDHWLSLVTYGEAAELSRWVDGMASRLVAVSAELALAGAGASLALGQLERAEGYVQLADAKAGAVPAKRRARYALSRAIVAMLDGRLRGDYEAARTAARKVLGGLHAAGASGSARALAHLNLGIAEHWTAELAGDGILHVEHGLELARREGRDYVVVDCLCQLALFRALEGSLQEASRHATSAVQLATRNGWDDHPHVASAFLALAISHLNWAEIDEADRNLRAAEHAARHSQSRTTSSLMILFRALVDARSDVSAAARMVHAVRNDIEAWGLPSALAAAAGLSEASLLADAAEPERALAALSRGGIAAEAPLEAAVIETRLALAEGDAPEALRRLEPHLYEDHKLQSPACAIEALALAALARHLTHDEEGAIELIEDALNRAQPEGFRLPLLAVGPPLLDVLRRRVRAGTRQRTLAGEVISLLEQRRAPDREDPRRLLLDPLSNREEAVLRYLPTVMSKAEIASELFVSINTVKTHTKNIYRKLGVGTRTEAVRRARHLNLV